MQVLPVQIAGVARGLQRISGSSGPSDNPVKQVPTPPPSWQSPVPHGREALARPPRVSQLLSPPAGPAAPVRMTPTRPAVEEEAGTPLDHSRLVPRLSKTEDGYWLLKEEFRKGINPQEKIKITKEPMKFLNAGSLEALAQTPFEELDAGKAGADEIDVRLKWLGLFHRRKRTYGRFMMRLKIPNGVVTADQMRYLASVIDKYGADGCADVTSRQNLQLRGLQLADTPEVFAGLEKVGLSSIQSGMDNVRNGVGNPLAGIDPFEVVDTRPYNQALHNFITSEGRGNPDFTNLPRKWNVCVVGSHDLYEHPHINDLAYMPAMKDGRFGFNLLVGGFLSSKRCTEAIPLDAWVTEEDMVPVCGAVLEAFRDLGARGNRQKCRMMWLIDELTLEGFRAEVEKRMPRHHLERAASDDLLDSLWQRRDYFGVHKQKQPGLNFVGCLVPVGRLQAEDMFEFARIGEQYGSGELRLTVEQNIIIPNVPDDKVVALLNEPLLERCSPEPTKLMASLVSCTGSQFCSLALVETKNRAVAFTKQLEATLDVPHTVRMHWTGCPNTCAQVQVADIGFLGCVARDENRNAVEGVDVYLGGRVGADSHFGTRVHASIPIEKLLPIVQDLLIDQFGATRKV